MCAVGDTRAQEACGSIAPAAGTSSAQGEEQHSQDMMTFTDARLATCGQACSARLGEGFAGSRCCGSAQAGPSGQ